MELPEKPKFDPLKSREVAGVAELQFKFVLVPDNRVTPLRKAWKVYFYDPIRNEMKIDIRMNMKRPRRVELMTTPDTPDLDNLQRCLHYLQAFMWGFDPQQVKDAFLKYDGFYLDSFDIKDVRGTLTGDHLVRAVGRICGKGGKTKFAIENATKTRIVVADQKIHICGTFAAIKIAKDSISRLILGSPAASVYSRLRTVATRASERF